MKKLFKYLCKLYANLYVNRYLKGYPLSKKDYERFMFCIRYIMEA